uniref:Uncharacterized protein n=1 Tax=Brassica oleracea var. oleracea TaxID=109376 RepID=A0A0D2ZZG6_BRAOL
NIPRNFRRTCGPRNFRRNSFSRNSVGNFRGKFISSEFRRKYPRDFRGKMNFRGVLSEDFFRRYFVGIALFRRHTDDFFPQYAAVFLYQLYNIMSFIIYTISAIKIVLRLIMHSIAGT